MAAALDGAARDPEVRAQIRGALVDAADALGRELDRVDARKLARIPRALGCPSCGHTGYPSEDRVWACPRRCAVWIEGKWFSMEEMP